MTMTTTTITVRWCWSKAIAVAFQSGSRARGADEAARIIVNVWPILCKYLHHVLPTHTHVRTALFYTFIIQNQTNKRNYTAICTTSWMNRTNFCRPFICCACCQKSTHWIELICWVFDIHCANSTRCCCCCRWFFLYASKSFTDNFLVFRFWFR